MAGVLQPHALAATVRQHQLHLAMRLCRRSSSAWLSASCVTIALSVTALKSSTCALSCTLDTLRCILNATTLTYMPQDASAHAHKLQLLQVTAATSGMHQQKRLFMEPRPCAKALHTFILRTGTSL